MTLAPHDVIVNCAIERLPNIITANADLPISLNLKRRPQKTMRSFLCNRETIFLIVLVFFTSLVQCFRSGSSDIRFIGRQLPLLRGTKMYFAIASMPSEQSYARAFNKALMNITQSYLEARLKQVRYNITLDTLAIELPENGSFSAVLLESLCAKFEGKHVVAVLIIGNTPAAQTVSLTATHAGIPVLWARGQGGVVPGFRSPKLNPLEIHLAPTGREMAQALRGLLLQTHWHTFTILADSESMSALQRHELRGTLSEHPLHPTLIALPSPPRAQIIFRKLADISRSTRGVVILLTGHNMAAKILDYAKRLNMLDGHFVWLWINSSNNQKYKNDTDEVMGGDKESSTATEKIEISRIEKRSVQDHFRNEINDMQFSSLLKNDHFLLLTNDHRRNSISTGSNSRAAGSSSYFSHRPSYSYLRTRRDTPSNVETVETPSSNTTKSDEKVVLTQGLLSLRSLPVRVDRHLVKGAVRLLVAALERTLYNIPIWLMDNLQRTQLSTSCWKQSGPSEQNFSLYLARELEAICSDALAGKRYSQDIGVDKVDKSLVSNFEILNLVPEHSQRDLDVTVSGGLNKSDISESGGLKWKRVGMVSGRSVRLDTIVWPGGDISVAAVSSRAKTVFRVVTALAPPFVMESDLDEDGQCLRGLPCHRVLTSDKDNLTLVFNELEYKHRQEGGEDDFLSNAEYKQQSGHDYEEDERFLPFQRFKYRTHCCYGLSMDLLENVAQELEFGFQLYIVADGLFGTKVVSRKRVKKDVDKAFLNYKFKRDGGVKPDRYEEEEMEVKWNGIIGDLVSGAAHMSFAPLSVSSARSEVIDYSVPYFFSGVSLLAAPRQKSEIPLMAFLLPFSPELWIAIFTSLNITAIAVAIYEWLSPFGLNPWGRQRSKNFSMSSALWVMWGLLCGHLVAFKAPKSWPNKFLINVWGGFSVIFVASYTANIAALIAGLFFHNTASNYLDGKLLSQRVGTPKASAAEYYIQRANSLLWEHMHKYSLENVEDGLERLRNGTLDIIIADTPILDYYRATDHGCKLQKIGDAINQDTYAIGMVKGFPLKDTISAIIAKYSSNGYMDILQEKWYGALPCFKLATEIAQPRPLGVAAVTGVFILLGVGIVLGCLILLVEHLFFKYTLPLLRDKPKGSIWRSRNIMFFSQKLYRFINCVELVSPHHAARELVNTIRQGQITSLFQKSIKRKEHEQRRRRKSKAQFFDMIQEIRRQQQQEREFPLESVKEVDSESIASEDKRIKHSPSIIRRTFMRTSPKLESSVKIKSPTTYFNKQLFSPRAKNKAKSSSNLNVRRFSTDSVVNSQTLKLDHSNAVGRRLSKDAGAFLTSSPPDINSRRSSYLDIISSGSKLSGKSPVLSIENVSECSSKSSEPLRKLSDSESIGRKLATLPKYKEPVDRHKLQPQYSLTIGRSEDAIIHKNELAQTSAKSCQNISDVENIEMTKMYSEEKNNLSDDEIARRNKETIEQLQSQLLANRPTLKPKDNNTKPKSVINPQIRIEIEDTSKVSAPTRKHLKTRHQSLGEKSVPETSKRGKLTEQSRSLDSNPPRRERSRSPRKCREHQDLPPAPPPPNCSPRNSNGRSPLERLSKDELVLLWRSSESELRSHLLKAIRDKEVVDDPP